MGKVVVRPTRESQYDAQHDVYGPIKPMNDTDANFTQGINRAWPRKVYEASLTGYDDLNFWYSIGMAITVILMFAILVICVATAVLFAYLNTRKYDDDGVRAIEEAASDSYDSIDLVDGYADVTLGDDMDDNSELLFYAGLDRPSAGISVGGGTRIMDSTLESPIPYGDSTTAEEDYDDKSFFMETPTPTPAPTPVPTPTPRRKRALDTNAVTQTKGYGSGGGVGGKRKRTASLSSSLSSSPPEPKISAADLKATPFPYQPNHNPFAQMRGIDICGKNFLSKETA